MSKKIIAILITILILMTGVLVTGCSLDSAAGDAPVFEKSLICMSDQDFETCYVSSDSWKKGVTEIAIKGADNGISTSIYGIRKEFKKIKIDWGMAFPDMQKKDFTFNEIEVTWSDGSKTTENIGAITVADIDDYSDHAVSWTDLSDIEDEMGARVNKVTEDCDLHLENAEAYEAAGFDENLYKYFESFTVNGKELSELILGEKIHLYKGETIELKVKPKARAEREFDSARFMIVLDTDNGKDISRNVVLIH